MEKMQKQNLRWYVLAVCRTYNSLILTIEEQRHKLSFDIADTMHIIEGYETALNLLGILHDLKVVNNIEFTHYVDRLCICLDCPHTHTVPCEHLFVHYLT